MEFGLSDGLVSSILSFLSAREACRLSLVCKQWANTTRSDERLWQRWFLDRFPRSLPVSKSWKDSYMVEWGWRFGEVNVTRLDFSVGELSCVGYDNETLMVCGGFNGALRVWDIEKGECIAEMSGHNSRITCVACDGGVIASGDMYGVVKVWEIGSWKCLWTFNDLKDRVVGFEFHENKVIGGDYGGLVSVWDLSGGASCLCIRMVDRLFHFCVEWPKACLHERVRVKVWNLETGNCMFVVEPIDRYSMLHIKSNVIVTTFKNVVRVQDASNGDILMSIEQQIDYGVIVARILPERKLLTRMDYGTLRVFDIDSGERFRTFKVAGGLITCANVDDRTPNGLEVACRGKVVVGYEDHSVRVWDLVSGECLRVLRDEDVDSEVVRCMGNVIVCGSWTNTWTIWQISPTYIKKESIGG